jgi:hypothetical protein
MGQTFEDGRSDLGSRATAPEGLHRWHAYFRFLLISAMTSSSRHRLRARRWIPCRSGLIRAEVFNRSSFVWRK